MRLTLFLCMDCKGPEGPVVGQFEAVAASLPRHMAA